MIYEYLDYIELTSWGKLTNHEVLWDFSNNLKLICSHHFGFHFVISMVY